MDFLGGIGLSVIAAIVGLIAQRWGERRSSLESKRFEIYMKFLDLQSLYARVVGAEIYREPVKPETTAKIGRVTWQIADLLRAADQLKHLEKILDVLLSERFPTAAERHDAMGEISKLLAQDVNPRYAEIVGRISQENLPLLVSRERPQNAPGSFSF